MASIMPYYNDSAIRESKEGGFNPECVLFDSWYSGMDNLKIICDLGWTWLTRLKMNHFNTIQDLPAEVMARWNNNIQKMAERSRLGIPVTLASDPRHAAGDNPGANVTTTSFSHWPTPLGLAATRDTVLVREFADIARQEYLSVGIRLGTSPHG